MNAVERQSVWVFMQEMLDQLRTVAETVNIDEPSQMARVLNRSRIAIRLMEDALSLLEADMDVRPTSGPIAIDQYRRHTLTDR